MPSNLSLSENIKLIEAVIADTKGDSDLFASTLKVNLIPHISFSQIVSVEFCQYQYYLQYVKLIEPEPQPIYFEKGRILHHIIASSYKKINDGLPIDIDEYYDLVDKHFSQEHNQHLKNAIRIHLNNLWENCQVIAVEKQFVMVIDNKLPPCVGIIDLILQQNDQIIIIDHKTGRDFYQRDVLQMAIYNNFIVKYLGLNNTKFFYDNYRWVNNLDRIRKPAIQRDEVFLPIRYWIDGLERIHSGYSQIKKIMTTKRAIKYGECFRCPYRSICK